MGFRIRNRLRWMGWRGALAALAWAAATGSSLAEPAPSPMAIRSAACVSALKARAEPLAERVRRGEAAAEVQLMPIVTASFAFIGTVYKQGLRAPKADELLREAEQAQATMPPDELTRLQDACQGEGRQLLADANFLEREIVRRAARSRIDKLRPRH